MISTSTIQLVHDMAGIVANLVTIVSAAIVAFVALKGLSQWRQQLKGTTDYQIARRYLKAALELRDAMIYVRNPFISNGEIEAALKEVGYEPIAKTGDSSAVDGAVYPRRWKKVQEAWTNLEVEVTEAEVSWGADAARVSQALTAKTRELFAALSMHIMPKDLALHDRNLIYDMSTPEKPDEFMKDVISAVDAIRDYLKPHLK